MQDEDGPREIDVRGYLRVLRRRKWVVLIGLVVVAGISIALALVQAPVYSASAEILVAPPASALTVDPQNPEFRDRGRTIQNEIEFIGSDVMAGAVAEQLGDPGTITVGAVEGADVLTFSATDGDAARAAEIANTYAETYIDLRAERLIDEYLSTIGVLQSRIGELRDQRALVVAPLDELDARIAETPPGPEADQLIVQRGNLDAQIGAQRQELDDSIQALEGSRQTLQVSNQLSQSAGAEVTTRASEPSDPVSPNVRRSATVGIVLGLLVGIAAAFAFERLDDTVKTKDDVERATDTVAIGLIPRLPDWKRRQDATLISLDEPQAPASEAYRTLRTSLQFLTLDGDVRTVLFTSSNPGEGKTTTVANLAVALARSGRSVIAVCCDLRRPRLHEFFGMDNSVGFTSILLGTSDLDEALQPCPDEPRLEILPSGAMPPNPSELLSTKRAGDLLAMLAERASIVLIDSPPVLPVTDALVLSSSADAMVLVVSSRKTTKKQAARSMEMLDRTETPTIGSVLNGVPADDDYGYGYGYTYHQASPPPPRRS